LIIFVFFFLIRLFNESGIDICPLTHHPRMQIVAVLSEIRDHPLLGKADAAIVGCSGFNL
jgi:hypothetical protein